MPIARAVLPRAWEPDQFYAEMPGATPGTKARGTYNFENKDQFESDLRMLRRNAETARGSN